MEEFINVHCKICHERFVSARTYLPHINMHLKNKECTDIADSEKARLESAGYSGNSLVPKSISCECQYCHKILSTATYARTHMQTCDHNSVMILAKAKEILRNTTDEKILEEFRQILGVSSNQSNFMQNNNQQYSQTNQFNAQNQYIHQGNVTVNNNNTYHITINNLSEEDLENVSLEEISDIVEKFVESKSQADFDELMVGMYKVIHCNQQHPENQNILITNKKTSTPFYVFKDNDWKMDGNIEVLRMEVERIYDLFNDHVESKLNDPSTYDERDKLLKLKSALKTIPWDEWNKHKTKQKLGKKCYFMSYDNRDMVSENFKASQQRLETKNTTITNETRSLRLDGSKLRLRLK